MLTRPFYLLLILSLLLLGWIQLEHQSELHAHEDNESCEICLFAGNISNGVAYTHALPTPPKLGRCYNAPLYQSPHLSRHGLPRPSQRAPPSLSTT